MTDGQKIDLQAENARMAATLERYTAALTAICDGKSVEACRRFACEALQESGAHSHVIPDESRPPHAAYVAQALEALEALDAPE